ncbi:MobF family relaxase [Leptolyngbya sp. FACHB-16]|uniref:MobF family relaxase n=1 Tax=unclassified Leptolyngbya TaxID=2650499 RepID=UPI0016824816|nr:MobF family relaxase [Leptolyngbya sp. FACHB-16]MBD2154526.1 relaxase domain-containing protein [Leptolyngbya sp. FACHB-16]
MESITAVGADQAAHYYSKDNYGSPQGEIQNSQWFGKGAAKLGLEGNIQADIFQQLLHAFTPEGQSLHRRQKATGKQRGGTDITLSPPKTFSLRVLIGGDDRLIKCHKKAVNATLNILEERCAQTRISQSGKRLKVCTGNLTIAQFLHDVSRALDPQIHTHCLIFNFTQRPDGRWQSLDNQALYQHKLFVGLIYRNELAIEVQKLGYPIERYEGGLWEIAGYQPEVLTHFSKRSQQIKSAVGENASSRQKEWAALRTRAPKGQAIPREELCAHWQSQAEALQIVHPQPITDYLPPELDTLGAVEAAIVECAERKKPFTQEDIFMQVFSDVGKYSITSVSDALADPALLELLDTYSNNYVRPPQNDSQTQNSSQQSNSGIQYPYNPSALEQFHEFLKTSTIKRKARNPARTWASSYGSDQPTTEDSAADLHRADLGEKTIEAQSTARHSLRAGSETAKPELQRTGGEISNHRESDQPTEATIHLDMGSVGDRTPEFPGPSSLADESASKDPSQTQQHRVEAQEHQPDNEQSQRADFLINYVVEAIERIGEESIQNNNYWATWNSANQELTIGRKADQAIIVQAYYQQEIEQWHVDYANVNTEDLQDFQNRQQARQQAEREHYHNLYAHFAPPHIHDPEQRVRLVAMQVWQWAKEEGMGEQEAAKEAGLTLMYNERIQQIARQQTNQAALDYINSTVREAIYQQSSVPPQKQLEL